MAEKYTIELEVDSKNSKKSVDSLAKAIDELSKSVDKFGDESKENIGCVNKESKEDEIGRESIKYNKPKHPADDKSTRADIKKNQR